jgi:two-component system, response regulator PdtaR
MKNKSILIVEDEPIVSLSLTHALCSWGFKAAAVPSGEEALVFVDQQPVHLILMDIRLKGKLDGIEAAVKILEKKKVPIIFLTAYADPEIIERIQASGAFGYLEKPYNDEELRDMIRSAL